LEGIRGRHTELVSVYIPAGYDLNKIINHLQQEQGTAANIKDKTTQKHVIDALEKMIRHLRIYKGTPEHGLAVFSGNASDQEGKVDTKVWSMEPPEIINTRIYRCDQSFKLDILKDMMDIKETYGLVVVDRREGTIGLLKGTNITELHSLTSGVPGKTRAGGQSAQRFERIREGAAKEFYRRIADVMNKEFLEMKTLKGILVGGPGPTKHEFLEKGFVNEQLKRKVISVQDLSYTGEFGLRELVDKSGDVISQEMIISEKRLVSKFFEILAKNPDKVTYGMEHVKKALEMGAVDKLLVSEDLDEREAEALEDQADSLGTEFNIISTDTPEGMQLRDLGKIAAILRFPLPM